MEGLVVGYLCLIFSKLVAGPNATNAQAQTILDFEPTTYDTEVTFSPLGDTPIAIVSVTGVAEEAPFGLTNFETSNYSQIDLETNEFTFNADPAAFGLEGLPILGDRAFGEGDNEIFGQSSGSAIINLEAGTITGSGTINILGGSGRFTNASGTLFFSEEDILNPDPTASQLGEAVVSSSIVVAEPVPEPSNNLSILGLGLISIGVWLGKSSFKFKLL